MRNTTFTLALLAVATVALLSGCNKQAPEAFLFDFYDNYLTLSCSEYDTPDYEQVQNCLHQYLSQRLYDELEQRRDFERDDWLDYDIFIQGQDCWPGICAERITRVEETDWYDVTIALPDFSSRDSVVVREHVFFYLQQGDHGWQIAAVDDLHNRVGSAPTKDEAALKQCQMKNI
ncbi:MAG: DUF3828 domain-containing protein [Bacteroidales bacterium]|nr:DUF3828 domain-containing protein [Bacteroidales bacterium]